MLPTQPLSIGAILDAGITLYRNSFKQVVPVAIIAAVPMTLVGALYTLSLGNVMGAEDPDAVYAAATMGMAIYMLLLYPMLTFNIHTVLSSLTTAARGEPVKLGAAVKRGLMLCLPYVLLMFLYGLLVGIGLLLLLVPGLILMVSMSLMFTVPHLEKRGAWGSLWRSHALVWGGNWFRTAAVITVAGIILFILTFLLSMASAVPYFFEAEAEAGVAEFAPGLLGVALSAVLELLMYGLAIPVFYAVTIVLHNDLLLRKEGADLEAELAALQKQEASPA